VVEGKASRERGRNTWLECVRRDVMELGMRVYDTEDSEIWRGNILVKHLSRTSMKNRR